MKNIILGILSAFSILFAIISSYAVYFSGFAFLVLLGAKIFGMQGIEWFSFIHFSVIMTPIYMIVGGFISIIFNFLLTAILMAFMDEK